MNIKNLEPEQIEMIKADYVKGMTINSISNKYKVGRGLIYKYCDNLIQNKKEKNIFDKVTRDKNELKLSLNELAIKYNISVNYVKRILYNKEFIEYMKSPDRELKKILENEIVYLIDRLTFNYSHTGAEDQKVYKYYNYIKSKLFYIELIDHPQLGWYYHCDSRGKNICDSRYAKRYFDCMEDCKKDLGKTLRKLGY